MTLLHLLVTLSALFGVLATALITGRFATPFWLYIVMFVAMYPLALPLLRLLSPDDTNIDGWLPYAMRMALGSLATLCVSPLFALTYERRNRKTAPEGATAPPS